MKKKIMILMGTLTLLIVASVLALFVYYSKQTGPVSKSSEEVIFTVESGSSQYKILDDLIEAGLTKDQTCGKIFLKLSHYSNLQANSYILNKNMSLKTIFDTMQNPDFKNILKTKLTITEGMTINEVAATLEKSKVVKLKKDEIIKKWKDEKYLKELIDEYWFLDKSILKEGIKHPLEGYLFPETYFITDTDTSLDKITRSLLDGTDHALAPLKDQIKKTEFSISQFLTFVSIVEKESLFDEDVPKIAGVFMNRLKKDMPLQSDVTVNYALNKTGVKVTYKQLETESPYNTYKHKGLPVGPICAVCEDTMKACINYTPSDYLYFFADQDGKVLYAKTFEEHEKNVKENRWY